MLESLFYKVVGISEYASAQVAAYNKSQFYSSFNKFGEIENADSGGGGGGKQKCKCILNTKY